MGLNEADYPPDFVFTWRHWRLPIVVAALILVCEASGDGGRNLLSLYRPGITQGEVWRLFTAHFVHLGVSHALLNVAGLGLVWYLVGPVFRGQAWILIGLTSALTIDIGLWVFEPELTWYVGLSGVLHGLLAAGLIGRLPTRRFEVWALAAILVVKIAYEQLAGPMPGSEATSGGAVVVGAHLYGSLGGALAGMICRHRVRGQSSL
jgi:rhomboid family GlyGly-CTERM serine protease